MSNCAYSCVCKGCGENGDSPHKLRDECEYYFPVMSILDFAEMMGSKRTIKVVCDCLHEFTKAKE